MLPRLGLAFGLCMTLCAPLWAAACGGSRAAASRSAAAPAPAAEPEPAEPTSASEELVYLFEELAGYVDRQRHDCNALADTLGAWTQQHGARYGELAAAAASETLPADELHDYRRRLEQALDTIVESTSACRESERAASAFDELDRLIDDDR